MNYIENTQACISSEIPQNNMLNLIVNPDSMGLPGPGEYSISMQNTKIYMALCIKNVLNILY